MATERLVSRHVGRASIATYPGLLVLDSGHGIRCRPGILERPERRQLRPRRPPAELICRISLCRHGLTWYSRLLAVHGGIEVVAELLVLRPQSVKFPTQMFHFPVEATDLALPEFGVLGLPLMFRDC